MKRLKAFNVMLLSLVGAVALVVLAGCYEERPYPPPGPPAYVEGYDYYYYPDEEVYFYPVTGVYFWFGGGGWHSGRHLPRGIVVRDEGRVNVRINSRVPYEHHEEIRSRYPAHAPAPHGEMMEHRGR